MNYDDGNDGDYYGDDSYDDDPTPLFLEDFLIPVHLPHPNCLPRITSLVPKTVSSFQFTCYQLAKFLIYLKRATESSLVQTDNKDEVQPKIGENIAKGTTDPRH